MAWTAQVISTDNRLEAFSVTVLYRNDAGIEVTRKPFNYTQPVDNTRITSDIQVYGNLISGITASAATADTLKVSPITIVATPLPSL